MRLEKCEIIENKSLARVKTNCEETLSQKHGIFDLDLGLALDSDLLGELGFVLRYHQTPRVLLDERGARVERVSRGGTAGALLPEDPMLSRR